MAEEHEIIDIEQEVALLLSRRTTDLFFASGHNLEKETFLDLFTNTAHDPDPKGRDTVPLPFPQGSGFRVAFCINNHLQTCQMDFWSQSYDYIT